MQVRNPYTGLVDYELLPTPVAVIEATCSRLRAAQPEWHAAGFEHRASVLREFAAVATGLRDDLVDALGRDTGRYALTLAEAGIAAKIEREITGARRWLAPPARIEHELGGVRAEQVWTPHGLVAAITPWNFPLSLSLLDSVPALLAGCAVIVKPSEVTPRFIDVMDRILERVPTLGDVFAYMRGDGAVGRQLVDMADFICFTGSTRTGRAIHQQAARRGIPVSLEMGGKDPMIVLPDADPEQAAIAAVMASCLASGQICTSIERIYVHSALHDAFVRELVRHATRVGLNCDDFRSGLIGPFIFERQAAVVRDHIEDAVARGARLHVGGRIVERGGSWCPATVLTDVDHGMKVMREETFGPLMPVMRYETVEQAIGLANDSSYGLNALVFGQDREQAIAVARRLSVGGVAVNRPGLPVMFREFEQDGRGDSGAGPSRMGRAGMSRFLRSTAVVASTVATDLKSDPMVRMALGIDT